MKGNTAAVSPAQTLVNIQYLRAVAALAVVWAHAREQFPLVRQTFPSDAGGHGVDLFFVISGFIMVYTTAHRTITPGDFFLRRFLRIAPLYWLTTLLVVAIALVAPSLLKSTVIDWPHVFGSFAFLAMPSPISPTYYWPVLVPGWTLNYEMAFYALFALTLWAPRALRVHLLCLVLAATVMAGTLTHASGVWGFYSDAIILSFGAGALVGQAYCSGLLSRLPSKWGWFAIAAGFLIWIEGHRYDMPHRVVAGGLPGVLLVTGACVIAPQTHRTLRGLEALGNATYSVYLSHIVSLAIIRTIWSKLHLPMTTPAHAVAFVALALIFSAWAGHMCYRWIENPTHQWLNQRRRK
jgi:exopolysaccharide production protein ExoZ